MNHLEFLRNSSRVPEFSHEISPSSPLQHRARRARKVQDSLCRPSHEQLAVRACGLSYQRGKSKEIEQPKMMKNVWFELRIIWNHDGLLLLYHIIWRTAHLAAFGTPMPKMFSQWQVAVQAIANHREIMVLIYGRSARVVFSRHYLGWRLHHECRLCSDHALRLGRTWFGYFGSM
jgi:hypothetical protein